MGQSWIRRSLGLVRVYGPTMSALLTRISSKVHALVQPGRQALHTCGVLAAPRDSEYVVDRRNYRLKVKAQRKRSRRWKKKSRPARRPRLLNRLRIGRRVLRDNRK